MRILRKLASCSLPCLFLSALAAQTGVVWRPLKPSVLPPPRFEGAMVYDEARDELVLFGGAVYTNGSYRPLNDTWVYKNQLWVKKTPTTSPQPRYGAGMVYDPPTKLVYLYGGTNSNSGFQQFNDLWKWDGANWTRLLTWTPKGTNPTGPWDSGRISYNPSRKRPVVFSGNNMARCSSPVYSNQTWALVPGSTGNPAKWVNLGASLSVLPPRRINAAMTTLGRLSSVVIHGGTYVTGCSAPNHFDYSDTWILGSKAWKRIAMSGTPPRRTHHGMFPWFGTSTVGLFGGASYSKNGGSTSFSQNYNDVWMLRYNASNSTWQWIQVSAGGSSSTFPSKRSSFQSAYDTKRRRYYVFGGFGSLTVHTKTPKILGDFWELRPVPALEGTPPSLSISQGGTQSFQLMGGSKSGGRLYLLMGTMNGTGTPWKLGSVNVPLVFDFYTLYTVLYPNSPVLVNSLGRLGPNGNAKAALNLFPNLLSTALVGRQLHHAYIVFGPLNLGISAASNAVPLLLKP